MPTSLAALIVNGESRRGQEWFELAEARLRSLDIELVHSELLRSPMLVQSAIERVIHRQVPVVCVGGGDGTIGAASKAFIGSSSTLGLLPLGTGNSLARDLDIPVEVDSACQVIKDGQRRLIDLGSVNGRCFVNVATVGLSTLIAENLDDEAKKRYGRIVYLVALFKAVAHGRRFAAQIVLPDETLQVRTMQVVIGNGRFHAGPFPITPDAEIDSGYLAGYSVNSSSRAVLLRYFLRLWHGRHIAMPEVVPFRAMGIRVQTRPIKKITVDGEGGLKTPAELQIHPGVLAVLVPRL
ncbi:MAG: lipid kinase [Fimbriimonadaceae bacterium]|nr:lipid kinase [Fimbriimonadaceae bacterium]